MTNKKILKAKMKIIVTTTINPITKALEKFIQKKDWHLVVVGDKKTPHVEYEKIKEITYLHPDEQHSRWPVLSELIGFNCIQRRNFGFLYAFGRGAEIVATVDDDNIPYDNWGENVLVNKTVEVDVYTCDNHVFDPLSITNYKQLWHRGYPWEMIKTKNNVSYLGKKSVKIDVQAGLWDGDPDIDAAERLMFSPMVKFDHIEPYHANKLTVFNSQNTFLSARVLSKYMMIPFVGRMDDIWGSYILQKSIPVNVAFTAASVYQDRNVQCLFKNLKNELLGYENNLEFVQSSNPLNLLSEKSRLAFEEYEKLFT